MCLVHNSFIVYFLKFFILHYVAVTCKLLWAYFGLCCLLVVRLVSGEWDVVGIPSCSFRTVDNARTAIRPLVKRWCWWLYTGHTVTSWFSRWRHCCSSLSSVHICIGLFHFFVIVRLIIFFTVIFACLKCFFSVVLGSLLWLSGFPRLQENPGKISSKVVHFSSGSNGKQEAIV